MREIVHIVRRLVPDLLVGRHPSVACVCTTQPTYLVFDDDAARPACVVHVGDAAAMRRSHYFLEALYQRIAAMVARPLCCAPWRDGLFVRIESGLAGVPWFRLADGLATPAAAQAVLDRALSALDAVHRATTEVVGGAPSVELRGALREQVLQCRRHGEAVPASTLMSVEQWIDRAVRPRVLPGVWQHGDFSLNNLLVAEESIGVIDFEEFGRTAVPLHDALGLALSFPLILGARCPIATGECAARCVAGQRQRGWDDLTIAGLMLHHVLWRINACSGRPTRARLRAVLVGVLAELAAAPQSWPAVLDLTLPRAA